MIAGLYGMADAGFGDPRAQLERLVAGGVGVVQLRCKGWSDEALRALALHGRALGVCVVVNDRVDVARTAGVWAHLGQGDGPGPVDVPYGRSCHTADEVDAVARLVTSGAADAPRYIGFGPVYATSTKDTGYSARGLDALADAVRRCPVPVVAIGGIGLANVEDVRATGVAAWAVIGGVWTATDPAAAIAALNRGPDPRPRSPGRAP